MTKLLECSPAHRARLVQLLRDARESHAQAEPKQSFYARLLRKPVFSDNLVSDAIRARVKFGVDLLRALDILSEAVGHDSLGKFELWDRQATPAQRVVALDRAIQLAEEGYDGWDRCS